MVRVRQHVRAAAAGTGLSLVDQTKVVTAASELARNVLVHAGGGTARVEVAESATGRTGTPDDIAAATAFLLGPNASFITGTDLLVDGGVIAAVKAGSPGN